jgi:DNA-directed RNA polymerase specialized sigma24 family protein
MSDENGGQANSVKHARQEGAEPGGSSLFRMFLQERDRLRRIAAGMGMAGADIDDVLQDVSVKVLKQPDQFEHEGAMAGWLIRTTVNRCLTE